MPIMAYIFHFLTEWKSSKFAKINFATSTALVAHEGHVYKITAVEVGTMETEADFDEYAKVLL
jgi:hypothetical protein